MTKNIAFLGIVRIKVLTFESVRHLLFELIVENCYKKSQLTQTLEF